MRRATTAAQVTTVTAGWGTDGGRGSPPIARTFTATVTEATADAVTLRAEIKVDRASFDMTWNQLGMLTGLATVTVVARFTQVAPKAAG